MSSLLVSSLWVAGGGALGAAARFLLAATLSAGGHVFPWVTLGINIAGSLAIGLVWGWVAGAEWFQQWGRLFLVVGVLGGFTTFSTFSLEALLMLQAQRYLAVAGYAAGSVLLCIAGAGAGYRLGELLR